MAHPLIRSNALSFGGLTILLVGLAVLRGVDHDESQ